MGAVKHVVAGLLGFATVVQALWNTEPDSMVAFYVYWDFPADRFNDFQTGTEAFVELTKQEPGNKYYGFTLRNTTAVCKEGYESGQAFLDHLTNVDTPLQATLQFANISRIEVHGPAEEFEVLRGPLASFVVSYNPLVEDSFYVPANWQAPDDKFVTMFVYWAYAAADYNAFEQGTADFVSLTKNEPGNVFYGFTLRNTTAVCKEAYVSAQAFLDHLTNVDTPLQAALQFSNITRIEAHGPAAELEMLRAPLASFSTTYWALEPGAFYMPCHYMTESGDGPTPQDTTVAFMVHWEFPADRYDDYLRGTDDFTDLTKTEPGCLFYGFTMQNTTAVCKEGYTDAQAFLDHLTNVDTPLQAALQYANITRIEVHGPANELQQLEGPLAGFSTTYWALHPSSFYQADKYNPPDDTSVAVMVHWEFPLENAAAFAEGTKDFVALTKMEPDNVYYGFTLLNTTAVCKEGYKNAQGFLDHLANVDTPLQAALEISQIVRIEVHGPAEELDQLRGPLAGFSTTYWPLEPGAFMKEVACDKPIYYGSTMRTTTCGEYRRVYRTECCGFSPDKGAPDLKMSCGAAKDQYKLEGCCGNPAQETMILN